MTNTFNKTSVAIVGNSNRVFNYTGGDSSKRYAAIVPEPGNTKNKGLQFRINEGWSADGKITASVTIKNTGKRDGIEIVQLYIKDKKSSTERPIMELKDFARVDLKTGESKTISFILDRSKLEYWTMNKKFEVEPGEFEVMVGASSADIRQKTMLKIQ